MSKNRKTLVWLGSMWVLVGLLAACSAKSPEPTVPTVPATPAQGGEPTAPLPTAPPMTVEVPEALLNRILDDLVARTGADRQSVEVLRAQAVVWSDGSLGCPQPGVMYTQVLVDGYWVVLRSGGEDYDYRATQSEYFLCEGSKLAPGTQPGLSPDQ